MKKISLKEIKNALSRDEMREITAGSGGGGKPCVNAPAACNFPGDLTTCCYPYQCLETKGWPDPPYECGIHL